MLLYFQIISGTHYEVNVGHKKGHVPGNVEAKLLVIGKVPVRRKSFLNLVKLTGNKIIFTIFRLIWNQTEFC